MIIANEHYNHMMCPWFKENGRLFEKYSMLIYCITIIINISNSYQSKYTTYIVFIDKKI